MSASTEDDRGEHRRLTIVSAGLREPSSTRLLADRLTEAAVAALAARGVDVDVTVVEVREHAHDLVNALSTGFASAPLQEALDAVTGADGLIAVTPVFSGSCSGLFKTFFDVIDDGALAGLPVLLGATAGTARHSLAVDHSLRPLFAYLRTLVVPTGVFAAAVDFGGSQDVDVSSRSSAHALSGLDTSGAPVLRGMPRAPALAGMAVSTLTVRVQRAADELAWLTLTRRPVPPASYALMATSSGMPAPRTAAATPVFLQ